MAQAANKKCEICMRASGLHYCSQCVQFFCHDCKMSHLRSKISRNHTFTTGSNIKVQAKSGVCKDHNEYFIYLCEDCDQLICRLCVTKAHRRHAVMNIEDSNKKVQKEIYRYLDSKVNNVSSSANVIEGRTKTYKIDVDETVNVIIEDGNRIKKMVDIKVDDLIKSLRERESIALQCLSKAHTECTYLLGEATRQQRIYQDMIKQCNEGALFHKMKKMKSDIYNLKSVDATSLTLTTYNRKNVNFSDVEKLFGNLTYLETEVNVKKVKQSFEPHDQPEQPKQEKKKYQPPITRSSAVRQHIYICIECGRSRLSETPPQYYSEDPYLRYNDWLDCAKCGRRKWHGYKGEA